MSKVLCVSLAGAVTAGALISELTLSPHYDAAIKAECNQRVFAKLDEISLEAGQTLNAGVDLGYAFLGATCSIVDADTNEVLYESKIPYKPNLLKKYQEGYEEPEVQWAVSLD